MNKKLISLALAAAILQACGGGSSGSDTPAQSSTISGVAAAGAPLAGSVTIKDSLGNSKSVIIGTNGSYSVDVTGMTAPFMFRAEGTVGGRTYVMHSAATSADINGNINITPFTDLIIANIAGQVAASYFDSGSFSTLSAAEIDAQETQLQQRLQSVFTAIGIDSSIDILRSTFTPDHTQLDAALDILRVETDTATGIATITNLITQEQITDDVSVTTDATALTDTTNITTALTDLQAITLAFDSFNALFATSLPSNTAVEALLDVSFLNDDNDGATFAADITSDPSLIGFTLSDIAIESLDPANGTATVAANMYKGGKVVGHMSNWQMVKVGNAWLMKGNQRKQDIYFAAHTVKSYYNSVTPSYMTGIELWMENPNVNNDGGIVDHVVLSGPGLGAGVTYTPQVSYPSGVYQISLSSVCSNPVGSYCVMQDDTNLSAIPDNAVYTITVYDAANIVLATYTEILEKRPFLNTELSSVAFPVVSQQSFLDFQNYSGGALTLSATMPAGVTSAWGKIQYADSTGASDFIEGSQNVVNGVATMSADFPIITSPDYLTRLDTYISYDDIYFREIMTAATKGY